MSTSVSNISITDREELREEILAAGFHSVGFCDSSVLESERAFLEKRGAGPFEPTDLPTRTDPSLWLSSVKTVVVVALSYFHDEPSRPSGLRGRLSRYCRGLDYHELMLERLQGVAASWSARLGAKTKCFVDTGPPLERAFAEKAGLGRLGKNTNLIAPRLGSWVFLGVMATDLEIPPDAPATYSICGSCRLCLDACPTQCLDEWVLDSEQCLGYLNQKHGEIPTEHRDAMGDWLFGCDVCQEVCPHNVKAVKNLVPEFAPLEKPGAFPSLLELVEMTNHQFAEWLLPTAADWRGPEAIRRNALVALGNSGRTEALSQLEEILPSLDPLLAEHAEWAIQKLTQEKKQNVSEVNK